MERTNRLSFILFFILVFLFLEENYTYHAWAAITSSHPRLILTDAKLAELRAKACYDENGNIISGCTPTSDWTKFYSLVSPYVNSGSYYGMKAWHFALVYMVTKDISYANRAISLADSQIAADYTQVRYDSFLYARDYLSNIALTYDWLFKFLTDAQKNSHISYINEILYEIWNPNNPNYSWSGWAINDPGNNYYYNFLLATAYAGLATYNENPNPPSLPFGGTTYTDILSFLSAKIEQQAIPNWLNTRGKGGGWHEGQNYGQMSKLHMFELFLILRNAGSTNYFSSLNFPKESLYYQLYSIQPGNQYEYSGGDLARDSSMPVCSYDRQMMLLLADGLEGTTESQYVQYWLNNIYPSMQWSFMHPWNFLLYKPSLPTKDFRELPLSYYAEGLGWINTCSSWQDDAVSVSFVSTDRIQSHQHQDQNSFVIFKNDWQVIDSATYSHSGIPLGSYTHNTFLIDGQGQRMGDGTGKIQKFEAGSDYTYVVGDSSDAYYSGAGDYGHGTTKLLNTFIRELVNIKPDYVIVFDRITPVSSSSVPTYLLHFRNQPSVEGNLVIAINGNGKIFQRTLLPSNFNINVVNENAVNSDLNSWRIELTPQVPQANNLFLNVLYPTSLTTISMPSTVRIDASTNNMVGAHIKDSSRNYVVMFSLDSNGANVTGTITYTISPTANARHLLFDLPPNTTYDVTYTPDGQTITVTPGSGSYKSSSQGILTFDVSYTGSVNPPPAPPGNLRVQ